MFFFTSLISNTFYAGDDYLAVTGILLTFNGGTTSHFVQVSIIDDKVDEIQETFIGSLKLVSVVGGVTVRPDVVQIIINNTDSKMIHLYKRNPFRL